MYSYNAYQLDVSSWQKLLLMGPSCGIVIKHTQKDVRTRNCVGDVTFFNILLLFTNISVQIF